MSDMNINAVIAQIRTLSGQMQMPGKVGGLTTPAEAASSPFAALLKQGVQQVNQTQKSAENMAAAFERGVPGVELPQVMLEMQKANVSFRALTEVRNRFVNVYQEIMNMPI